MSRASKPRIISTVAAALWLTMRLAGGADEERLAAEIERTQREMKRSEAEKAALQKTLGPQVEELDRQIAALKEKRSALERQLASVLAGAETAAPRAVQAQIETVRAQIGALEAERDLAVKRIEEAGRRSGLYHERAADLQLALDMDLRVMLATAADIEGREKLIDACKKEISSLQSEVQRYRSRRREAKAELQKLAAEGRAASQSLAASRRSSRDSKWKAELERTLAERLQWLQRAEEAQNRWLILYKTLEDRAVRSLAYARQDLDVKTRYAALLARKEAERRVAEAQSAADQAGKAESEARKAVEVRTAALKQDLAVAGKRVQDALTALGKASTPKQQEEAQLAYDLALAVRGMLEADVDFVKEFLSYHKALSAYASDKLNKAELAAAELNRSGIERNLRALRESAQVSEQFIAGFASILQRLDATLDSAAKKLAIAPGDLPAALQNLAADVPSLASLKPGNPQLLEEMLKERARSFAASLSLPPSEARSVVATEVAFLAGQRRLVQQRLDIAKEWLEGTQKTIALLETRASGLLWRQSDARLGWRTILDIADATGAIWSDATFVLDVYASGCARAVRYAGWTGWLLALLVLGAILAVGLVWRARLGRSSESWAEPVVRQTLPAVPALLAAGVAIPLLLPGNRLGCLLEAVLVAAGLWWLARSVFAAATAQWSTDPSSAKACACTGVSWMLAASATALALGATASVSESGSDIRALLLRLWGIVALAAVVRLLIHPTLLGRYLGRKSENWLLRLLGGSLAWVCVAALALAVVPYLLSFDTLAEVVIRAVVLSAVIAFAGWLAELAVPWMISRAAKAGQPIPVLNAILSGLWKTILAVIVVALVAIVWWQVLRDVLLSPNAPASVQQFVELIRSLAHSLVAAWRFQLASGMTVGSLMTGIAVFALSFWISRIARRVFIQRVLARTPMDEATRTTMSSILGYLIIVIGFFVGLNVAGSSLQNFALLAGAITVGLGFGLQNIVNNFVSSLLIHFSRTIRVGDYIDAGGQRGTVKEIGFRYTMLQTDDGVTVMIPNGAFVSGNIVNWTNPARATRVHVPATIARTADLSAATQTLIEVALAHPLVAKKPAPTVEVRSVTPTTVAVELLAWSERPAQLPTLVGELSLATDRALREKGFAPG